MTNFEKIVRIGTLPIYAGTERRMNVYCKIAFEAGKLSITGVEGPTNGGNCLGSCGQIEMSLPVDGWEFAEGWNVEILATFLSTWREWHLNDMTAGSPAQMAYLRKNPVIAGAQSHYDLACAALAGAGLNPDNGYAYGSKWLKREVPEDALTFLRGLPDTDKTPAWI